MSLRTPLARARGLGSAKRGTEHWWHQRVTSIALVPLILVFATFVLSLVGAPYETAKAVLGHPFVAGLGILLVITVFYHLKLGMQVVVEDYVHIEWMKITVQLFVGGGCVLLGLACIISILRIAFGG